LLSWTPDWPIFTALGPEFSSCTPLLLSNKPNVPNWNASPHMPRVNGSRHLKNGFLVCWQPSPSKSSAKGSPCPRYKPRCGAVGEVTVTPASLEWLFASVALKENGDGISLVAFVLFGTFDFERSGFMLAADSILRHLPARFQPDIRLRLEALVFSADVLTFAFCSIKDITPRYGASIISVSLQDRVALFTHAW
jgi:hypothetical protein